MAVLVVLSAVVLLAGCVTTRESQPPQGIIMHDPDQGNEVLLHARELIQDLGWEIRNESRAEESKGGNIVIDAVDATGADVTFIDFWTRDGTAGLLVRTEAEAQYTPSELTTEVARRLGLTDAPPLTEK
jgi:hypothetical protein